MEPQPPQPEPHKPSPRVAPSMATLASINVDGSRREIVTSDVRGRFITGRRVVFAILLAIYVAAPLVQIGGQPAVRFDIVARKFYLFGAVFNAQDVWRALFLLIAFASAALLATAVLGRVWCGWACPQTVFLEGIYRRIERMFEGTREQRLKRNRQGWSLERAARAFGAHTGYIAISWALAHIALALFVPVKELGAMILDGPANHEEPFAWAMAFTVGLYVNFAFFREQMCTVICPYGRLQSSLQDSDSMIVGYDEKRGEPRGRLERRDHAHGNGAVNPSDIPVGGLVALSVNGSAALGAAVAKGDCVDCLRCVNVCPTGIDIRQGLQMECLACAQCIDACDEVMEKIGKPKGLIRYDSLNGLAGLPRRIWRPRVAFYGLLFLVSSVGFAATVVNRTPFEANVLRGAGIPYMMSGELIRNSVELHLENKNPDARTYHLEVRSPVAVDAIITQQDVRLESLESRRVPIMLSVKKADVIGRFELEFVTREKESGKELVAKAKFLTPPMPKR